MIWSSSCGRGHELVVMRWWSCGRDHAVRQEKTTDDSTRQTTRHDRRHDTKHARSLGRLQCTFVVNKLWSFVKMLSYRGPYTNFKALLPSRRPCSRLRRVFFRIESNVFLHTFRQGGTLANFYFWRFFRTLGKSNAAAHIYNVLCRVCSLGDHVRFVCNLLSRIVVLLPLWCFRLIYFARFLSLLRVALFSMLCERLRHKLYFATCVVDILPWRRQTTPPPTERNNEWKLVWSLKKVAKL
jgi:hypothetical protein